jgi:hypothetical protein
MCYFGSDPVQIAKARQTELLREAAQMRLAKEASMLNKLNQRQGQTPLRMSRRARWLTRLGNQLIQWGFQLLRPEPLSLGMRPAQALAYETSTGGTYRLSGRPKGVPTTPRPPAIPLYLYTRVTREIEIETTQYGSYYFTHYRSPHRVAALERYTTDMAARRGHQKWVKKDWEHKTFSAIILEEE